jgi:signal transduction histidine kinase
MRVNKSLNDPCAHPGHNEEERSADTTDFFFRAIENADGVPFQLIFGPRIGEGYYLNMGAGIKGLLGIPPEDLTEKKFREMIEKVVPLSDDISQDPEEARRKFISGELKSYRAEILVRSAGGESRWIRDASLPLTDEETGKVIGAFGILYDISKNRDPENSVNLAEKRADELDSLKKAFLHNISHEIRTPLNAIIGFSTLLNEPGYGCEQQQEFRDIITRSSDHLLAMITDIVELSKIEARMVKIRKGKINLNQMLLKVYNQFRMKASEKNLSFTFRAAFNDDDAYFVTDAARLTQVLLHLVSNAFKFTKEGRVDFGYEEKGGSIEFFVTDTGVGILEEHQPEIFSGFYQADSSSTRCYEGTGLGLTIAKAYVELLGGSIWLTSEPGKGTEFRFTAELESEEETE